MPSKQMSLLIFIGESMNVKSNSMHIPSISFFSLQEMETKLL